MGERAHVDLLFVDDSLGKTYTVGRITDAVSRFQLAAILADRSSASMVDFRLRMWWPLLGPPRQIIADQGRGFISEELGGRFPPSVRYCGAWCGAGEFLQPFGRARLACLHATGLRFENLPELPW